VIGCSHELVTHCLDDCLKRIARYRCRLVRDDRFICEERQNVRRKVRFCDSLDAGVSITYFPDGNSADACHIYMDLTLLDLKPPASHRHLPQKFLSLFLEYRCSLRVGFGKLADNC
jgi:hypothetical protein